MKISELNPCSSDIDHLKAFSFLSELEDLKKELPSYLAKVDSTAEIRKQTPPMDSGMQTGVTGAAILSSS